MEGIGALAIESIHYRNIILQAEGLSLVMKIMECTTNKETRKQGVKTLASICENIIPKDGIVKNAIELLAPVIKDESDPDVLEHAAWTMASLAGINFVSTSCKRTHSQMGENHLFSS